MTDVDARKAASLAASQLADIAGKPAIGATSVQRTDSGWDIHVELIEDTRVPSSRDLLGTYSVQLDETGALMGYRQVRRYVRGSADGGSR